MALPISILMRNTIGWQWVKLKEINSVFQQINKILEGQIQP